MHSSRHFNRRGLVLALLALLIFISLIFVSPVKAMTVCQPGEVCTFNLASANTPCGFNQRHFFESFGSSWEFTAGEQKKVTDKFGKFALAHNYAWTARADGSGIYGGCICDTASWLNYVAQLNGFTTFAESLYADKYTMPQVPFGYSVTIDVDENGNGSNLQLTNSSSEPLTLKWSLDEADDTVSIWVEGGNQKLPLDLGGIAPSAPDYIDSESQAQPIGIPSPQIVSIAKILFLIILAISILFLLTRLFRTEPSQ